MNQYNQQELKKPEADRAPHVKNFGCFPQPSYVMASVGYTPDILGEVLMFRKIDGIDTADLERSPAEVGRSDATNEYKVRVFSKIMDMKKFPGYVNLQFSTTATTTTTTNPFD